MDFRFALRSLRRNPGFTILAVLVMALGIGANTAVFSVVNTVLLKPLDFHDPDRIVTLVNYLHRAGQPTGTNPLVSSPDFHDWHDQNSAFSAMAYYAPNTTSIRAGNSAEYADVAAVTTDFFRVFEIQPVAGRLFSEEEEKPHGSGAAVISYSFWQTHYGARSTAVGDHLRVRDKTLTIVGVLPPRFRFPDPTDIWYPANTIFEETTGRSSHNYLVVARLKPDVSLEASQAQMTAIASRLEQLFPRTNIGKGVQVTRLRDALTGDVRGTLYLLLGAVALVLLIACANMANLLLAKATSRVREIAIRAAVGASRGRIIRQLITESLVLATVSGAAGLLLALWGSNALVALAPSNVPRLAETQIDGWVLAFTLAVSLAASVLFGLAPAIQASRVDLNEALKLGSGRTVGGGSAGRIRAGIVVAEIALSVLLLAGAGLLLKSFGALQRTALGFRPENVLVMSASVPASDVESARRGGRFYSDLIAAASTMPGVSAAGATRVPPGRVGSNGGYWLDHDPRPEEFTISSPQAVFSVVAPGAFAALGIPLRRGRDFDDRDDYDAPATAIINESLAQTAFPGRDPIGHTIVCGFDSPKQMRIVGVVGDIRQYGPARPPSPELFMPYRQHPGAGMSMSLVARTSGDPAAYFEAMRRKAREISPDVPVRFTTMELRLSENIAAPRFRTLLLAVFAALAVCLAMAGVYGVMAYAVSQRSAEIGLRIALGASSGNVMALILKQGLLLAVAGLLIGLAGAAASARILANMLFQVKPGDPLTYAAVAALLGTVALAATYIPARRAAQLDPLKALRQE